GDLRLEHLVQIGLEPRARPFLLGLAEAAIAGDIGGHHRGEPALHTPDPPATKGLTPLLTGIMANDRAPVNCRMDGQADCARSHQLWQESTVSTRRRSGCNRTVRSVVRRRLRPRRSCIPGR